VRASHGDLPGSGRRGVPAPPPVGPADNACTTATIPAQGCLPAPRRRSVADHPQTLQTPTARYNRRHGNLATRRPGTRSTAAAGNRLPAARVNGRVRQRFSRHRNGT